MSGMFDMSVFGKIRVEGRMRDAFCNASAAADVAVEPGKIVYTQFLNPRGGIEADVTVTRLARPISSCHSRATACAI